MPEIEGEFFSISPWCPRLSVRNSRLVLMCEIEKEKFSFSSRSWKSDSRWPLIQCIGWGGCWVLGVAASYKGWRVEGGGVSRLLHFKDSPGGWSNFFLDLFYVSLSFLLFLCVFISNVALRRFTSWMKSFPENQNPNHYQFNGQNLNHTPTLHINISNRP